MSLVETLQEALNSGDSELRTWFLVRHNYLPFILCGSYALFVTIVGPAIMKNREPFTLRIPMILFNLFLVVAYTGSVLTIFFNLPTLGAETFCKGAPVRKGDLTYKLTSCCWVIYILKYVEFLDTVFFILRKKYNLVTFLHVMHHTIVPILGWIIMRTERGGFQTIPVLLNACVHIIMYSYYGLSAIGPHMRKYLWWKKYLTLLQMVQFILMVVFVTIIAPLSGCSIGKLSRVMDFFLPPMFFFLFYDFYRNSFQKGKQKRL